MGKIVSSKKLTVATLLGTVAFISNGFLPSPVDKMFILIQALSFALSSLVIAKSGAVYASLVNGILLSLFRTGFFPFSLFFSVIYGLLIVFSLTLATGITGVASMFLTTVMGLIPMVASMYLAVLVVGVLNGVAASYLTLLIWNRQLSRHFQGRP